MDKNYRYFNLLKCGNFGLGLPKGSLMNYLKIRRGKLAETVGGENVSFPLVSVFATRRCNLSCSFCICGKIPDNWRDYEMTPDKLDIILNLSSVAKSLMIVFTGGEPTINPDLPKLMRMARDKKHLVGIISNGVLLKDYAAELHAAGLCDAQVSVYDNTMSRLSDSLVAASSRFAVNASYVFLKSKLDEMKTSGFGMMERLIELCVDSGCSSLKLNMFQSVPGNPDYDESISDDDGAYTEMIRHLKSRYNNVCFSGYDCKDNLLPTKRFTVFFPDPVSKGNESSVLRSCRLPWTLGTFDGLGRYGLCCGTNIPEEINDLFKHGEGIINCDYAKQIRRCLIDDSVPMAKACAKCAYLSGSYISNL